jgi:hypothetical protein
MSESVSLLMIQFLDWVSIRRRTYADAMDAWRTSCPRSSIWEDALIDGLIDVTEFEVTLTARGLEILERFQNSNGPRSG